VAYADLREFVKKLEKEGELKRIRAEVDPVLEIAEVTQRVARRRAGTELRWAGAAVREAEGVAASIADQRVWKRAADGVGVRGGKAG